MRYTKFGSSDLRREGDPRLVNRQSENQIAGGYHDEQKISRVLFGQRRHRRRGEDPGGGGGGGPLRDQTADALYPRRPGLDQQEVPQQRGDE